MAALMGTDLFLVPLGAVDIADCLPLVVYFWLLRWSCRNFFFFGRRSNVWFQFAVRHFVLPAQTGFKTGRGVR